MPVDLPPANEQQAREWLTKKLSDLILPGTFRRGTPHLGRPPQVVVKGVNDPLQVWKHLFDRLKAFRQDRFPDRRGGAGRGRSKWPEPNAIRDETITGQNHPNHPPPPHDENIVKFPRAVFGLPIVFHFKDRGDPDDVTLQLDANNDRFASPLILKPLACQNAQAIGLAVVLQGSEVPDNLFLKNVPRERSTVTRTLSSEEADAIPPLNGNPDVLQAFLNSL